MWLSKDFRKSCEMFGYKKEQLMAPNQNVAQCYVLGLQYDFAFKQKVTT
jgi:hypothetical protein